MTRLLLGTALILFSCSAFMAQSTTTPAGLTGKWQVTMVPNAPWVFELTADETSVYGTIRQSGADNNTVTIMEGKVNGTTIVFKVKSPDNQRIITFNGRVNGNEISFVRHIVVAKGGKRGGNDLFGSSAALQFVAQRAR